MDQEVLLVIDGEQQSRQSLAKLLDKAFSECDILLADTPQAGLKIAKTTPISLVISKVNLHTPDPFEVVHAIRSSADIPELPVFVIGQNANATCSAVSALEAGAADFISDSATNSEFIARLNTLLHTKRTVDRYRKANSKLGMSLAHRTAELRSANERLIQSQKMEAIGLLAGGVAHDFNNLLTAILGNAQLLEMYVEKEPDSAKLTENIVSAASRAAELTGNLLSFSRKGNLQNKAVDVHKLCEDVVELLTRTVDPKIEIFQSLQADSFAVTGAGSQIHTAILNLAINACDAMKKGGKLYFITRCVEVDRFVKGSHGLTLSPGKFIEISIADTGTGMCDKTSQKVFEPFFTTKEIGRGTGLGLPAVFNCAKNHQGDIRVASQLGKGTTFTLVLPLCEKAILKVNKARAKQTKKGKGTILIVDDERMIRKFAINALTHLGYDFHQCEDGQDAIEFYRENHSKVDLVLLDIVMPRVDGWDAFDAMRKINPQAKIILSSGFNASRISRAQKLDGCLGLLNKPYTVDQLAEELSKHLPVRA